MGFGISYVSSKKAVVLMLSAFFYDFEELEVRVLYFISHSAAGWLNQIHNLSCEFGGRAYAWFC
jgi:hypothetical protein